MMKKSLLLLVCILLGTTISLAQKKQSDIVVKRSGVATAKQVPTRPSMLATSFPKMTMKSQTVAKTVAKAPRRADEANTCTVTLTAGDVWGDNSGYQMLLDPDAKGYDAYSSLGITQALYAMFEYTIPRGADCNTDTRNIVFENSVTITIPAGTYDWMILNPSPGDRIYIAGGGTGDNFEFEAGRVYVFTVAMGEDRHDHVTYTIDGEAPEVIKYKRPAGTFFSADYYETDEGEEVGYYYLYAPNGAPLTFTNYSSKPETTTWMSGDEELTEEEVVDNNAVLTFNARVGGYLDELPTLQKENKIYSCSDGTYYGSSSAIDLGQVGVYVPRDKTYLTVFDLTRGDDYYGYAPPTSTMPARFGFGGIYPQGVDTDGDGQADMYGYPSALFQYFEKPASPLYLEEVQLPIHTDKIDGAYTGIPEGKQLVMNFVKADEDGNMTNEVLGTFTCTSEDCIISGNWEPDANIGYGYVSFYNLTEDEFGNPMIEGIVINDPFYIVITGLNQEGVDVGFRLNDISGVNAEFEYSEPTIEAFAFEDGSVRYSSNKGYITRFYLYGVMDNVEVLKDGLEWLRINEEDKIGYTDIEDLENAISAAVVIPTRTWITSEEDEDTGEVYEEESYSFVFDDGTGETDEAPDWLEVGYEESELEGYSAYTYIIMQAKDAMPAKSMRRAASDGNIIEVDGRRGRFCAVSIQGLCNTSDKMYVIQGDLTHEDVLNALGAPTGIETVTANQKTTTPAKGLYNLAGQRVNKDYHGIMIQDGKKLIK